ncbi:MAG: DUF4271 domain-containing protein [Flavobacteriales bacterium]|nr:MAG: DUF4271 domain-containing protein [Flavobacteriales bacterium]
MFVLSFFQGTQVVENSTRIIENNDGVIGAILLCICLYLLMIFYFRGEYSIKEFFVSNVEETSNAKVSWGITSFCFMLLTSVLLVDFVPFVPSFIKGIVLNGYSLSKFGFVFSSLLAFYFLRLVFTYFYYQSIGEWKKWKVFYFYVTKYYFSASILLMILNFINYYLIIDKVIFFSFLNVLLVILVIFKLLFYRFHYAHFLPEKWYYKFLYICTLQIAPMLALWKLLFIK